MLKKKTKKKMNFKKLLKGNNKCTIKCTKNSQNILQSLKKTNIKLEKNFEKDKKKVSKKKLSTEKYLTNIFNKYNNLICKLKKRKHFKNFLECFCNKCKNQFKDTEKKSNNIIQILKIIDITSSDDENFKQLLNNSILFSNKLTMEIENFCK